jgi:hypothetical protein
LWPIDGDVIIDKLSKGFDSFKTKYDCLLENFSKRETIAKFRSTYPITNKHACNIFRYERISSLDLQNIQLYLEVMDFNNTKEDIIEMFKEMSRVKNTSSRFEIRSNYYPNATQTQINSMKNAIILKYSSGPNKVGANWITFSKKSCMFFNVDEMIKQELLFWECVKTNYTIIMRLWSIRSKKYDAKIKALYTEKLPKKIMKFKFTDNSCLRIELYDLNQLKTRFHHQEKILHHLLYTYKSDGNFSYQLYFLGKCYNESTNKRIWFSNHSVSSFFQSFGV